jgi:hypothetical protein
VSAASHAYACGIEDGPREKVHPSLPLVAAILAFPGRHAEDDRMFRRDVLRWYRATRRMAVKAAKEATA